MHSSTNLVQPEAVAPTMPDINEAIDINTVTEDDKSNQSTHVGLSVAETDSSLMPVPRGDYVTNIDEIDSSYEIHLLPNKNILMWKKSAQLISPLLYDIETKKIIKTYPSFNRHDCTIHINKIENIIGEAALFWGHKNSKHSPSKLHLYTPSNHYADDGNSYTNSLVYNFNNGMYQSPHVDTEDYFVSCYEDSEICKENPGINDVRSCWLESNDRVACYAVTGANGSGSYGYLFNPMFIATSSYKQKSISVYAALSSTPALFLRKKWDAHKYSVSALAFIDHIPLTLASAGNNSTFFNFNDSAIHIWNALEGTLLYSLSNIYTITKLLKLPNGWLCSAGSNNIQLWDLKTKKVVSAHPSDGALVLTGDQYLAIVEKDKIRFLEVSEPVLIVDGNSTPCRNWKKITVCKSKTLKGLHIHNSEIQTIVKLLSKSTTLTSLNLSNNKFGEPGLITLLSAVCNLTSTIRILNLAGNNLKYYEFRLVAENVKFSRNLTHINLSSNKADLSKEFFLGLLKDFRASVSLTEVDISNNYTEQCSDLMIAQPNAHVANNQHSDNPIYNFSIFKMKAGQTKSLLDPERNINRNEWIVSMSCKNVSDGKKIKIGHSFIHLEGMLENGSVFMRRFDIKPDDNGREATVIVDEEQNKSIFDYHDYALVSFPITRIQGEVLQSIIEKDRKIKVPFSSLNVTEERINCTKWCMIKLSQINVHVPPNKWDPRPVTYSNRKF